MRILGYKLSVTAQIGIVIVILNVLLAVFAPLIAPFDQATPVGDAWADPDAQHWLGLDNVGRKIGGLPVVAEGKLVGIVTTSDLLKVFLNVVKATSEIIQR